MPTSDATGPAPCPRGSGRPSSRMVPDSTVSRRLMARHSVDLPDPDGPMTTTTSRSATARSMSLRTWRSPKCLLTRSNSTSGRDAASWDASAGVKVQTITSAAGPRRAAWPAVSARAAPCSTSRPPRAFRSDPCRRDLPRRPRATRRGRPPRRLLPTSVPFLPRPVPGPVSDRQEPRSGTSLAGGLTSPRVLLTLSRILGKLHCEMLREPLPDTAGIPSRGHPGCHSVAGSCSPGALLPRSGGPHRRAGTPVLGTPGRAGLSAAVLWRSFFSGPDGTAYPIGRPGLTNRSAKP